MKQKRSVKMKKVIEIKSLTKSYKQVKAIDALSLEAYEGEILGLLGPNGSGKSTTINCLLSLLNFDQGSIKIFGKEMTPDAYDTKAKIGVVFQDVAVFEELTVEENIDYFCGLYIQDKATRKKYVEEAMDLVGLHEFTKFKPKQLSGGLLRRLNIACGIAHKPSLIILDEPTVAVDPQSRNHILEGIKKLNEQGATIIYTTHYMEEAEILCSRIIIIDKGKVIASGDKETLKSLISTKEKVTMEVEGLKEKDIEELNALQTVEDAVYDGKILYITYKEGKQNISDLITFVKQKKCIYDKVFSERPTLNDVFLELTGKELRD